MRAEHGKYFVSILLVLTASWLCAQEVHVRGGFVEDNLRVGQPVTFWLVAEYPPALEMVFPDSNARYGTFEWIATTYYPTQLIDGAAYDSTAYTLQSFEIDQKQFLKLEAFILNADDTVSYSTPWDSIFLTELAPVVTDTTQLKTNLDFQVVGSRFNYPLMYYVLGGLALLLILLALIFGRQIIKYFKLRGLARDYRLFSEALDGHIGALKKEPTALQAEQAVLLWKKYQQRLEKLAFTTLTTKEILDLKFTSELANPLKSIDRAIYGKHTDERLYQEFQLIENFAQERYKQKVSDIKHGK